MYFQARRGTIAAAAAVGQGLQRFGLGIMLAALGAPPFLDAVDGERRGVGGLADEDGAGIGPRVVDTVGDGEAFGLGAEVVVLDPFGAAIPVPFPMTSREGLAASGKPPGASRGPSASST